MYTAVPPLKGEAPTANTVPVHETEDPRFTETLALQRRLLPALEATF